jgi:hypothetical protein
MSVVLTQLAFDNFFRANEQPLVSPPWTVDTFGDPSLSVVSDTCSATAQSAYNGELFTGTSLPNNQYSSATLEGTLPFAAGVMVGIRLTDNGVTIPQIPGYFFRVNYNGAWTMTSAGAQIAAGSGLTISAGDTFAIAAVGTTLYAFQNGVQLTSVVDSTYASGVAALVLPTGFASGQISKFAVGSAALGATISGNAGVAGATVSWTGTSSGSTSADGSGNYTTPALPNGSYTLAPSLTGYSFSPASQNETISGSNITGVNFTASSYYSVPDTRNYGNFPNSTRDVQGTLIYDVPSVFSLKYWFDQMFNRTQPTPLDSRTAGAPVDSRNGDTPQNSRTQPPFED